MATKPGGDLDVLLPLRIKGDQPPLFCIHTAVGIAWSYAALAAGLPKRQPLYALQARSLVKRDGLPATVEEMAADYIAQIRSIQPSGPYRLLGWSFGGVVAHAVATTLQAAGERVELLALLDSYPSVGAAAPQDEAELAVEIRHMLATVGAGELGEELTAAVQRTAVGNAALAAAFKPGEFDGDVLFFTATEDRSATAATAEAWRPHVSGRIDAYEVACGHTAMTQPATATDIGRIIAKDLLRITGRPESRRQL